MATNERTAVHDLLEAIDCELARRTAPRRELPLYLLGRASLILGLGGEMASESTKDIDVVDAIGTTWRSRS